MRILVIAGGNGPERAISLKSGENVLSALRSRGHDASMFDYVHGDDALMGVLPGNDVAFPILHGKEGEDGTLYRLLADSGMPYVGSEPSGARTAFDKALFKEWCAANGVPDAPWRDIASESDVRAFGFPCVLKCAEGGSSLEVALLPDGEAMHVAHVRQLFAHSGRKFVERMVRGVEVTAGVLGDTALPLIEIRPPDGKWFDFDNKYSGDSMELPHAPSVAPEMQKRVQDVALAIHRGLNLGSFSRTDVIIDGDDIVVLEVNTPGGVGMTSESLFPKAAMAAGIPFAELCERIASSAQSVRAPTQTVCEVSVS